MLVLTLCSAMESTPQAHQRLWGTFNLYDQITVNYPTLTLSRTGQVFNSPPVISQDKQPQLVECPAIAASAFRLVAGLLIGTLSNSRQILQRNAGRKRFCSFNDAFRDIMVYPTLESTLTTRQPLQQLTAKDSVPLARTPSRTACALTGFVLERGSQTGKVVTSPHLNAFTGRFFCLAALRAPATRQQTC